LIGAVKRTTRRGQLHLDRSGSPISRNEHGYAALHAWTLGLRPLMLATRGTSIKIVMALGMIWELMVGRTVTIGNDLFDQTPYSGYVPAFHGLIISR